jgi:hypothetical protein
MTDHVETGLEAEHGVDPGELGDTVAGGPIGGRREMKPVLWDFVEVKRNAPAGFWEGSGFLHG